MSYQQCAVSQPATDTDTAVACSTAAIAARERTIGAYDVFEDIDLKLMKHVLDTVCRELKIAPDSDEQKVAALAVIRHAVAGAVDEASLAKSVAAELRNT